MKVSMKSGAMALMVGMTALPSIAAAENVLKWGSQRDIFSLDPYSIGSTSNLAFLNHIYEGLVRYTPTFEIEPALAESWEFIEPNVWRFKLREDVTFHNGATFDADDVMASMERVSHPDSPLRGNIPTFVSATKVDDFTVDIKVQSANPLFLNDMTNIFMFDADWLMDNDAMGPTDIASDTQNYTSHNTNGTGPFVLLERIPDTRAILEVNPDWWDEAKHNLDRIEFTPITSAPTRVAALISGEIDLTDAAPIQDVSRLEATPDVQVVTGSDLRTVSIGMNRQETLKDGRDNPFNNADLREAVDLAIDRDLINDRIMSGLANPTGVLVAPAIPGYDETLDTYEYNPDRARELISQAGFEGLNFVLQCASDESINEEQACQALISMLTQVGLEPTLDIAPRAVQSPKRSNREADMYLLGWANEPTLDAYSMLVQVLSTREGAAGLANYGGWSYPEIDRLTQEAATTMDREARLALEAEALGIAKEENAMIPLWQQPMVWAMSDAIEDITIRPDNKPRHWLTVMSQD
ncbi:ABC transporter substrate-binding protein [uncultured Aliiroseovarius sp.]|uniref:ABC transporter substrate-binding protein n=1 Tax=uncultured Aliiroseovarius sp. TaxID=1658783 RepID=UPI00259A2E14|nr:ABC transporter substrate-binding protein [uncultured Aliiroseovarius sp.]